MKMKINYTDFIKTLSKRTGYTQTDIREVLNAVSAQLADNLIAGDETVIIQGLVIGTTTAKERNAKNPQTGESMIIPSHKKIKIKVTDKIKNIIR